MTARRSFGKVVAVIVMVLALAALVALPARRRGVTPVATTHESVGPSDAAGPDAEIPSQDAAREATISGFDAATDASAARDTDLDADVDAALDAGPYEEPDADLSIESWSADDRCAAEVRKTVSALSAFVHRERTRIAAISVPGSPSHFGVARADIAIANVEQYLPKHLCHATNGGMWSLVFTDFRGDLASDLRPSALAKEPNYAADENPKISRYAGVDVTASVHLYFTPNDADAGSDAGAIQASSPLPWYVRSEPDGATIAFSSIDDVQSGDVDADGRDEALILGDTGEDSNIEGPGRHVHHAAVYTAAQQHIRPLGELPPVLIKEMTDADRDGRMDFLSSDPFRGEDEGPLGDIPIEGPPLLIHSTPKGFSRDDAAAQMYAKTICPSRPTRLFAPRPDAGSSAGIEVYLTDVGNEAIKNTVCSRLWGVAPATLRTWLTQATGGTELTRWVSLAPPLLL